MSSANISHMIMSSGSSVGSLKFKIHPVVLFNILDHYTRRNKGQERVIGTLLGVQKEGTIEIMNSFPVPHSETEDQVAIVMEFHQTMSNLHARVNPKEKIVGWYATGGKLDENSFLIHDFYGKKIQHPVHVLVDPTLQKGELSTKCYISNPVTIGETTIGSQFHEVSLEIKASESERVGVNSLLKNLEQEQSGQAPAEVLSELDSIEISIKKIIELLDSVSAYVNKVQSGEIPPNKEIGRMLADTLASVPSIDPAVFNKEFNNSLQDLLMVSYLTDITRAQLALAEKLQSTTL